MKMTLFTHISYDRGGGGGQHFATAQFSTDVPFAPAVGTSIGQSAWKDARKVASVTLELGAESDEPYLYVYMGESRVPTQESARSEVEMYKGHGWKIIGGR